LRELIEGAGYPTLRPTLTDRLLADYIADHPDIITQWSMYSDDKRTTDGWYFVHEVDSWIVGRLGLRGKRAVEHRYNSAAEACARFVLAELDFWTALQSS
jgi:hypothetical protein